MHVLVFNSGSSSLKFGLYAIDASSGTVLLDGEAQALAASDSRLVARRGDGTPLVDERAPIADQQAAVERIGRAIAAAGLPAPDAIGHRIVHGGPTLRAHCRIDDDVLGRLDGAVAFAPLHAPPALAVIRYAREHFAGLPQVACFDTVFHVTLAERSRVLPLPKALRSQGIERYGFHGLSCESIVAQLRDALPARLIVAHLGNGASVTAVLDGRSIDTSMGLTPSGGVIMGTRSGDLDPGVLLYLMREKRLTPEALETLVDHRSGLLGISDASSDMRTLRKRSDADAHLAIEMFCHAVACRIAGMIVSLDGVEHLVFTGGIGEHDVETRATICSQLRWMGIALDDANNRNAANPLASRTSRCAISVLPSQEDLQIARHTRDLVA